MKQYFVHYYRNFGNTFSLYYAETAEDMAAIAELGNAQRITRREAEKLAASEIRSRKVDPAFSGYGDTAIYPAADAGNVDFDNSRRHEKVGYIWERK